MGKLIEIETLDATAGRQFVDLEPLPTSAVLLFFSGTTDAAQTLALSDFGTLRVNRYQNPRLIREFDFFHQWDDLHLGYPWTVAGAATTAETVAFYIPFHVPGIPNVWDIESQDEVDLDLDFSTGNLATRFGANAFTCNVYQVIEPELMESYDLLMQEQDIVLSASTTFFEKLEGGNIAELYIADPDSVLTSITWTADGRDVINNVDKNPIQAYTDMMNKIESTGNTLIKRSLVESGQIQAGFNVNNQIRGVVSGAGEIELTKVMVQLPRNPEGKRKRAQERRQRLQAAA